MNTVKELLNQIALLPETITASEKKGNKHLYRKQIELLKQTKKIRSIKRRKNHDL